MSYMVYTIQYFKENFVLFLYVNRFQLGMGCGHVFKAYLLWEWNSKQYYCPFPGVWGLHRGLQRDFSTSSQRLRAISWASLGMASKMSIVTIFRHKNFMKKLIFIGIYSWKNKFQQPSIFGISHLSCMINISTY